MIASIHGILEAQCEDQLIVRVGGFGLRVFVPASTRNRFSTPGSEVSLYTHLHVREDGLALYGFAEEAERDMFELLIGVSGVGPKVALALLSALDAPTFYRAIAQEDVQLLARAPGVGKKLAGRLVLELKGKVPAVAPGTASAAGIRRSEVLEALVGLGYSPAAAQAAIARLPQDQNLTLEEQITLALRSLAREL
ncbi:Holliday junction branch migration protein RuvA [Thermogemmatispora tikiterensis]|uniref:Holliday junction branch migration complex subunit RuvA n=1 Tax=Thermogemmatispora tikiterensis TaxID=1825093 RepID=A0A328VGI9_9CHLR|nr:Holliday junction branch migration protein RuvA [Thermogemmatispora tikiterensis]RAQ95212.1 Holliday junction DNA helicase RuvA [Thermogemmatispora tikiterensis]